MARGDRGRGPAGLNKNTFKKFFSGELNIHTHANRKTLTTPQGVRILYGMTTEPISRGDRITWQRDGTQHHGRVEHIAGGFYMARSDQGARDALRRPHMTKERT